MEYKTPNSNLWDVKYVIDAWGNLTNKNPQSGYQPVENFQSSANNANQITGVTYDNGASPTTVGNVTFDGHFNYAFDAENRISSVTGGPTYKYDGDGERVQKSTGETYWGGGAGNALLETDNSGTPTSEYIYFLGKRVARRFLPSGLIRYYVNDSIGSATVLTDIGGGVDDIYDYAPYGEEHVIQNNDTNYPNHYYFTGKERDSETGLDNFGFRYYGSNMGRFMSPDEPMYDPDLQDPQKLNLYSYTRNNPLNSVDEDGHLVVVCTNDEKGNKSCVSMSDQDYYNAVNKGNNPGVNAPQWGQSGDITCGGQVCGHATYMDEGAVNPEGESILAGWAFGKITGAALGWAGGKIAGWLGRGAGAAGEVGGKVGTGAARATVDDILEGTSKGPVSSSRQFFKPGGMPQATADFQQLAGDSNVTTYGQVKVAELPDGSKAILRGYSSQGSPTLEIQPPAGKAIKVRYQ